MVIPVYIAEISPQRSRGKLSSTIGPMFAGGLLVGFAVNLGCVEFDIGWRVSLGLQSVFGVVFVFGMIFLPKSPRFLVELILIAKPELVTISEACCCMLCSIAMYNVANSGHSGVGD